MISTTQIYKYVTLNGIHTIYAFPFNIDTTFNLVKKQLK